METYILNNTLRQEALDKNLTLENNLIFLCGVANFIATPFSLTKDAVAIDWNSLSTAEKTCVNANISALVDSTNVRIIKVWQYACISIIELQDILNMETTSEYHILQWQDSSKMEILYR